MNAVNLLPDRSRGAQNALVARGGAYVVVGILGVLLVMALALTLTANQANSRKTEAAKVKQEADQAEARATQLGAFGSFASVKTTRTAAVKQLATGRFDWERFIREIGEVLPEGAWVQDVNASASGNLDGGGNTAATPSTAAAPKLPAAELTGCTAHQSDVADLMVRLRKLYLVSDVELKSAERGDSLGKATIENCGSYVKFDLSVSFSAAAPTKTEVPQGHRGVPAKLGGGS